MFFIRTKLISEGAGVDYKAYGRVVSFIAKALYDKTLTKLTNKGWGREDESTLCLEFTSFAHAARAEAELKRISNSQRVGVQRVLRCEPVQIDPRS